MKARIMNVITLTLLFCLLLTAVACGHTPPANPEKDTDPASSTAETSGKDTDNTPPVSEDGGTNTYEPETYPEIEVNTTRPVYPGDIDIELPEIQETPKIILSVKDGKVLGASSLDKPMDSDIIDNLSDFQKLYGTVEGIDESFFESNVLRLVHSAQSSSSTRYAVESVTTEGDKIKVEIIEQHAAISTRDLRYWYVFAAVEKAQADTPVEVNVTSIQLAE